MQLAPSDKDSLLKLSQLKCAMEYNGSIEVCEEILQGKGDINYKVPESALTKNDKFFFGFTALHFSQEYHVRTKRLTQLLLKYGLDITIKNNKGETALHKTIKESDYRCEPVADIVYEIFSTHVRKRITENPSDKHGLTHFHIACMTDNFQAAELFLDNGVLVDLVVGKDSTIFPECTPLHIGVKSSALGVVMVLLEHNANQHLKDEEGMTAMHWIIEENRKIVDFEVLEWNDTLVDKFSELEKNQQIVELLMSSNDDECCTLDGHKIKSFIDVDEIGLSDFHIACTLGNKSIVEQLLFQVTQIDHQVNSNSHLWPGYTALHFAAHFDLDTFNFLLARGANIMTESTNGCTPFEICLERYPIKEIQFIMSTQSQWSSITLLDEKIKLLDLISAMQDIDEFRLFLDKYVDDINTSISRESSLWPGFTILHLAVLFSEQTKNKLNYTFNKNQFNRIEARFNPHLGLVEECLSRGATVYTQDLFGSTPLHLAFRYQKTATIKKLFEFYHIAVNPVDKYNVSHLHIACTAADGNIAKKLMQSDTANLNLAVLSDFKCIIRNGEKYSFVHLPIGSTPLHVAVAIKNYEMTKLLVDNGANVNVIDKNGVTPIHRLLDPTWEDLSTISGILLSANLIEVVVADSGLSHLHVASYYGNGDAVKRLLDLGANVHVRLGCMSTLINFYRRYGFAKTCRKLHEKATALHMSISHGTRSDEVINLLIEHGADIFAKDVDGMSVIHNIIFNENIFMSSIQSIIQNGSLEKRIEEESGLTAIHFATLQLDVAAISKLIKNGVDVNARIKDNFPRRAGCTALHLLAYNCHLIHGPKKDSMVETIKILIAAGSDVTLTDAEGNTPVHVIFKCTTGIYQTKFIGLILNGIKDYSVNPIGEHGLSLFHIASLQNDIPIMKNFLEKGVDIDAQINLFNSSDFDEFSAAGNSALHLVIMTSSYDGNALSAIGTIDFLLEHGAGLDVRNSYGDTPLHYAMHVATNRIDIVKRLIKAGADLKALNVKSDTPFATLLSTLRHPANPKEIEFFINCGCRVNVFNSMSGEGYLSRPLYLDEILFDNQIEIFENFEALFKSSDVILTDEEGRTAIHNIVSLDGRELASFPADNYTKVISRLCSMGCDIDSQDSSGETALHYATRYFINNTAIIALLRNGADVNIVDDWGKTAIHYALKHFESQLPKEEEWYNSMIEIFYVHLSKLLSLNLNLNEVNRNLLSKVASININNASYKKSMARFPKEVNAIKKFKFKEGSTAIFMLNDLLFETGIIAAYSFVASVQSLIKKILTMIDTQLVNFIETIGIYKLQIRKAVKRMSLIDSAKMSLKDCVRTEPFPFPEVCCDIVLRFLSNMDLENLIASTDDDSVIK